MYHVLLYTTVDDYLERRGAFRAEHLQLAQNANKTGDLLMAGALAEPADGAILIFKGKAEVAKAFAENDPYVKNGLIKSWEVRPWTVVIGGE
ncbi:MAG: YciI family protein [Cryomorphaceae bacterium]|nr:YciI family protein [Cryomorphaceae bacterium]